MIKQKVVTVYVNIILHLKVNNLYRSTYIKWLDVDVLWRYTVTTSILVRSGITYLNLYL